ncbi:MAG: phosphate/phosphite/phosphonate ABC transporter substrate-binding protein, partial [Candidatus Omnitrophica bacterium]|nr:phosphate/phosphite/phosphonate ABC transporter substrate-binding protein [Candidatus Omnitrophota bacterium]
MKNKIILLLMLCVLASFPSAFAEPGRESRLCRIGVLANRPPDKVQKQWEHLAAYLDQHVTDAKFQILLLPEPNLEAAVREGQVDFIITPPVQYITFNDKYSVQSIATMESLAGEDPQPFLAGAVVVLRSRSDLRSIRDLRGKRLVAADEDDLGGTLAVWRELKERGIDPFKDLHSLRFLGDEKKVVEAILKGSADAGAVNADALQRLARQGELDLSMIVVIQEAAFSNKNPGILSRTRSTRLYPNWSFARTQKAGPDLSKKVAVALFQMTREDTPAAATGYAGWTISLDYGPVRACLSDIGYGRSIHAPGKFFPEFSQVHKLQILGVFFILGMLVALILYIVLLNRRFIRSSEALQRQIREKDKVGDSLRKNEVALKNMIFDLA